MPIMIQQCIIILEVTLIPFVQPLLVYIFAVFQHSSIGSAGNKKTRLWKNLKQIVAAEKALPWGPDDTTCMLTHLEIKGL